MHSFITFCKLLFSDKLETTDFAKWERHASSQLISYPTNLIVVNIELHISRRLLQNAEFRISVNFCFQSVQWDCCWKCYRKWKGHQHSTHSRSQHGLKFNNFHHNFHQHVHQSCPSGEFKYWSPNEIRAGRIPAKGSTINCNSNDGDLLLDFIKWSSRKYQYLHRYCKNKLHAHSHQLLFV